MEKLLVIMCIQTATSVQKKIELGVVKYVPKKQVCTTQRAVVYTLGVPQGARGPTPAELVLSISVEIGYF